jgi:glycosyltransferase involved in cell wall biosynthesis
MHFETWIIPTLLFGIVTLIQLAYHLLVFRRLAFLRSPSEKEVSRTHAVSVIVCARDEAENLANNLPGVLLQDYPSTHEVIVVDDNSVDESRYLLEGLHKEFRHLKPVTLQQEAMHIPGKKFPLSVGIKTARHEILLMTDADCVPASEHWISRMQEAYDDETEIVLGYGAYRKGKGLLNRIIRYDTFHSAMQYLSFALAGMPYMGVGRNLSYRREVFFRHKGFSAHNHISGGDDDLFVNMAANRSNTAVVVDPDSFTLSKPKQRFGDWVRQKYRHYSTAKYYKPMHRWLLGLYSMSHILFLPLFVVCLVWGDWRIALGLFALRFITQAVILTKSMKRLGEGDLRPWFWLFDIWMFLQYLLFIPAVWKAPRQGWK